MLDLASFDDTMDCTSSRVMIRRNRLGQFNPFAFTTTEAEYRRFKNHFHVVTNCVEPGFKLPPSSTPPSGRRGLMKGSNTEFIR
ncbi:unnamed protein product [Schistocephalus solidus]|uniref:Uncharacterized protein n=1 Tax=Schistocephalus solidus TaxID=70667 RepID=A0A183STP0_SCHSO|nr:unnamed protein product [Schistocephalus solidus]